MWTTNGRLLHELKLMRLQMAIDFTGFRNQLQKNADANSAIKALVQKLLAEIEQIATTADAPTQNALNDLTSQFGAQTDDLVAATLADTAADPANAQPGSSVSKPVDPNAPAGTQTGGSQ